MGDALGPLPSAWGSPANAQFTLSREEILSHPRSFYERVYDWITRASKFGKDIGTSRLTPGHFLEHGWRIMFSRGKNCKSTAFSCTERDGTAWPHVFETAAAQCT